MAEGRPSSATADAKARLSSLSASRHKEKCRCAALGANIHIEMLATQRHPATSALTFPFRQSQRSGFRFRDRYGRLALPLLAGALPPPVPVVAGDCVAAVPPVFDVL